MGENLEAQRTFTGSFLFAIKFSVDEVVPPWIKAWARPPGRDVHEGRIESLADDDSGCVASYGKVLRLFIDRALGQGWRIE